MEKILIIGLIFTLSLAAQEPLSLQQAWAIALRENPTLSGSRESQKEASKQIAIEKTALLPTLSLNASANYTSELAVLDLPLNIPEADNLAVGVKDQYDFAIGAKQTFFSGGRIGNQIKAAKSQNDVVGWQLKAQENQLLLQVGLQFSTVQMQINARELVEEGQRRTSRQLSQMRQLLAAEQLVPFDTLVAANRLLSLVIQAEKLGDEEASARERLGDLLGIAEDVNIEADGLIQAPTTIANLEECLSRAARQRPELSATRATQNTLALQEKAIRSAIWPQLYGEAAWHYGRPGPNFFDDSWSGYGTAGLKLQWQLWDWGKTRQQAAQKKVRARQTELTYQQLNSDIESQVRSAYRRWKTLQQQLLLQEKIVSQEKQRSDILSLRLREGQIDQVAWDDAESQLLEARLEYQRYRIEAQQAILQLLFATGDIARFAQ